MKHPLLWPRILSPERLRRTCCLSLFCVLAWTIPAWSELSIRDDRGATIRLDQPAVRIVALYAAFGEILTDLGQAHCLLACAGSDTSLPPIGTHLRPNAERILALGPDLVLQLGGRDGALESVHFLENLGLTVAVFDLESFDQLFSVMQRLGTLTGATEQAQQRTASMQAELDQLQTAHSSPKPRIFFEARYPNLLAAGQRSMVSEIIRLAGGTNCVPIETKLARLGEEEVLRLDPDIYLIQQGPMNPNPLPVQERSLLRPLSCVRTGQTFIVDQSLFSRPGPRNLDAVRELTAIVENWKRYRAEACGALPHPPQGAAAP